MNDSNRRRRVRFSPNLSTQWSDVVQLVGTFGLAVFLVLYYVLIVQPRQQVQYDKLRQSVEAVVRVVEAQQSMVSREQAGRLEELFLLAISPELADEVERMLGDGAPVPAADAGRLRTQLEQSVDELIVVRSRLLKGFLRRDREDVAQALVTALASGNVSERLASRAVNDWPYASRSELESACRESLFASLQKVPERR